VKYFFDFADRIKDDLNTKEMIRLYAQDELSSATWLLESCGALNALANKAAASSLNAMMNE
jgi:hypothetical protein